jgi:hypothetical protein
VGSNTAGTAPTPTGTVTFSLCGPTATDSTAVCTTGGSSAGTGSLSDSSPPAGEAQATSGTVNTAANPLLPGRYCFRADWPGDSFYKTALTHAGTGNSECFIVRQIATTTVTTPSDASGAALTSPVPFGTDIHDKAVVTGTAAGGNPPGSVEFFYCDPSQVQGSAGSETCSTGGTSLGSETLSADAGSSPPTSSALSDGVAANKAGVWCFRAVYTPTGSTYTGSSDSSHTECVTVAKANTQTVTTPSDNSGTALTGPVAVGTNVKDKAVVTGVTGGGAPDGTVKFEVCNPLQTTPHLSGPTCEAGSGTVVDAAAALTPAGGTPPTSTALSSAVTATTVGTWCFRATYAPAAGSNYNGSGDSSTTECFRVVDTTSASSLQTWRPNDSATITSTGGSVIDGTLSFTLYSGGTCDGTVLRAAQTFDINEASPATRGTTNTTVDVSADATVSWKVEFTSDNPDVGNSSHCEKTFLDITN